MCYIDYKKAFDFVNRQNLWYKLIKEGIEGEMWNAVLHVMVYCKNGLFQEEVLSPLLFSLYVNYCEMNFLNDNCSSIELQNLNLFLILYADDMVILSETPEG